MYNQYRYGICKVYTTATYSRKDDPAIEWEERLEIHDDCFPVPAKKWYGLFADITYAKERPFPPASGATLPASSPAGT